MVTVFRTIPEDIDIEVLCDIDQVLSDEASSAPFLSVDMLIEMWQDLVLAHAASQCGSMAEMEDFIENYFDDLGIDMRSTLFSVALASDLTLDDTETDAIFNSPQVNLLDRRKSWFSGEYVFVNERSSRWAL